jgi:hypothetical protein
MVNKYGIKETLIEYHSNNEKSYHFGIDDDGYCFEYTYDLNSKQLTYRNSEGVSKGFDKTKQETNEAPKHYNNDKGSLYKVAEERGWNPYLFDIVKRLERSEKKGEFTSDLEKSKFVIDLWLNESNSISI